jgi:hypothetical protein
MMPRRRCCASCVADAVARQCSGCALLASRSCEARVNGRAARVVGRRVTAMQRAGVAGRRMRCCTPPLHVRLRRLSLSATVPRQQHKQLHTLAFPSAASLAPQSAPLARTHGHLLAAAAGARGGVLRGRRAAAAGRLRAAAQRCRRRARGATQLAGGARRRRCETRCSVASPRRGASGRAAAAGWRSGKRQQGVAFAPTASGASGRPLRALPPPTGCHARGDVAAARRGAVGATFAAGWRSRDAHNTSGAQPSVLHPCNAGARAPLAAPPPPPAHLSPRRAPCTHRPPGGALWGAHRAARAPHAPR